MFTKNIAHQAFVLVRSAYFTSASNMLDDVAPQDRPSTSTRPMRPCATLTVLCIDEAYSLSRSPRCGALLFKVVTRCHLNPKTNPEDYDQGFQ
jgi:hypothetical protein